MGSATVTQRPIEPPVRSAGDLPGIVIDLRLIDADQDDL